MIDVAPEIALKAKMLQSQVELTKSMVLIQLLINKNSHIPD
jgi:hypothetical protein